MPSKKKSLIIVHTGDGKGKTTAAMGMVFRMVAHGWRAAVIQFIKSSDKYRYGEQILAEQMPLLDVFTLGKGFTWTNDEETNRRSVLSAWEKSKEAILSGKYHMVVLDEINNVIDYGFLEEESVLALLDQKPKHVHLVLTGRNAKASIIEKADLVTEMQCVKHPYKEQGIVAQKGIEW